MPEEPRTLTLSVAAPPSPVARSLTAGVELTVGRDPGCDVRLDDPRVSARHCRVVWKDAAPWVQDLGSGNGTRVNGLPVDEAALSPGDRIGVGGSLLVLHDLASTAPVFTLTASGPVAAAEPLCLEAGASVEAGAPPATHADEAKATGSLFGAVVTLLEGGEGDSEEDLLRRVLDGLVAAFRADRGCIFEVAGAGQPPRPLAAVRWEDIDAPASRRLVERVDRKQRAILLSSSQTEDLRGEIQSIGADLRSIVAAPLRLGGQRGVIYLDSLALRRAYDDGDRELLWTFSRAASESLARRAAMRRMARTSERLREVQRRTQAGAEILGESGPIRHLIAEIGRVATSDLAVLVQGESGTGKELVARALHRTGPRRDQPFVPVNCAAVPADLMESEFFGHEKGAFSGAAARRLGMLELAHGGTLFLDEVGELPLELQAKLLRALQEREVRRLGGSEVVPVDFRLVCATNRDLRVAADAGRFRDDLYFRIAGYPLAVPPLRERDRDVLLLAHRFLESFSKGLGRGPLTLAPEAERALMGSPWIGNVRELQNVVHQAVIRTDGTVVGIEALFPGRAPAPGTPGAPPGTQAEGDVPPGATAPDLDEPRFDLAKKLFEARYLAKRIRDHKGNMKATAEAIGLSRKALYRKCEEYGIDYRALR